ncbi:hypothetical protein AURDEDRAFT_150915 [Auricularia subglabra TFB-10046 SS5]|nr:hypothetical protein AURDEDRAFT_150915 [Auricularia subglabra TFB-10046 SS5]
MYDEQDGWDDLVPTSRADADFVPASRADAGLVPAARGTDVMQLIYDAPEDGEVPDEIEGVAQVDEAAEPEDGELPPAPEPHLPRPREPSRALLDSINHRTTLQLLKHYRHWLTLASSSSRTLAVTPHHARWLFALLAHLPAPAELVADEMAVLRQTAKAVLALLRAQRAWADEADSAEDGESGQGRNAEEAGWWLAFAGVASGFGQRDLWDDASAALA